jgi:hypothetical protein
MEQKRRPRRKQLRSRKRLNWGSIFSTLLTINVLAACFWSKVTAIRSINLDGVRNSERLRLNRIANDIKGIPALKVDPRVVESPFMNESRIKNADFRRNIFGVARLTLLYRTAIASISGSKDTFLDDTGVIFTDPEEKSVLSPILLQDKIKVSVMAISGVINFKQLADLVQIVRSNLPVSLTGGIPPEIEVQETGAVCLNMNGGIVILGTSEDLEEKIGKLKQALLDNPNLFKDNISINMMRPSLPQMTPRKKDSG